MYIIIVKYMCTAEIGPFESHDQPQSAHSQSHCSHASVSRSQGQLCATVEVKHAVGKESQPFVVESWLVDRRRNAHIYRSHLGEFVSTRIRRAL
jgi:hypothetical protein